MKYTKELAFLASKTSLGAYIEKMAKFHVVAFTMNQKTPINLANKNTRQNDPFSKDSKFYSFQLAALKEKPQQTPQTPQTPQTKKSNEEKEIHDKPQKNEIVKAVETSSLDYIGAQEHIKFYASANVKIKDIKYKEMKSGTNITFDLLKRNSGDKKKVKGYICVIIEKKQGKALIFPKNSQVQGEICSKGQYSRFAWLRPSSFKARNLSPREINSIKILYRPLK